MAEGSARLRVVLLAVAAALGIGGFVLFAAAPDPETLGPAGDAVLRSVETQRVQAETVRSRGEVAAMLEPRRSVRLYAETRGPVIEVGAEALDRVESARVLVRIDPLEAEVAVERSRANVARSESERALASAELARQRSLTRRGVASDADLDSAENAEKVAAAVLRQARAELQQAEDDLAKKTIAAPFDGVLRSFEVEEGEYVQPGQELGELIDLTSARARIGVSDRQVVAVRPGQSVELTLDAWPREVFRGQVLRVGSAFDRETRKFPVEVEFPNPDGRLLPGMVGSVALEVGEADPRTVVPREATVDEFGLRFVWVLEQQGDGLVASRRRIQVRPIPFRPADFEVLGGLAEGEEIALSAVRQLREGERVRRNGRGPR
ncbi:MAG: efflux RND transporter periplasmic adaptor subunit [Myxococcota bacterium]|nr:efflux RND transporter periplasmic adaptor subunit [Myxococcota bacterium]